MANGERTAPTRTRRLVVLLTLAVIAIAYLDRVCISTAAPAMQRDLGLDKAQMGMVFSAFTLSYALFEIPAGWFADRFGARKSLARIVVFWSAMTAATGLVTSFGALLAVRLLFGVGEAGAFPSTARVYSRWLPAGERASTFGATIMTGALAGAATQPLVVWLLPQIGWRGCFMLFGAVGLSWVVVWWSWFRDEPRDHRGVNAAELALIGVAEPERHGRVPFAEIVRNPTVLALCFAYAGTIYGWYFYLTWLPTYLLEARGFALNTMGWLSATPLVGIALGVLCGGVLADFLPRRLGKRLGVRIQAFVGLPAAGSAVVLAINTPDARAAAWLLACAAFFAALGVAPSWSLCVEIGGPHAGVVSGTMNMFGNLGGTAVSLVVGFCLHELGSWNASLYTIAALYALSALCWLWVDPGRGLVAAVSPRTA